VSDSQAFPSVKRRALLVLGMHRSGTSSIAGTFAILGAKPPRTLMAPNKGNARGYWESVKLMELNDEILASAGSGWSDWRPISRKWFDLPEAEHYKTKAIGLLEAEYGYCPTIVIKDPRICRLLPFWVDVLEACNIEPKIILPSRSPLEVAHSLKRVHGLPLPHGVLLWLRHVLEAEKESRTFSRSFLSWKRFLSDTHLCLKDLGNDLEIVFPSMSDQTAVRVDEFLSEDLRHFSVSEEELDTHPDVHTWVKKVYWALESLTQDRDSNSALSTLNEVSEAFDLATAIFGRVVARSDADVVLLRSEAEVYERRIVDLEMKISSTQRQATDLQEAIRDRDERLSELEARCIAQDAELRQQAQEEEGRQRRVSELEVQVAMAAAEVTSMHDVVRARDARIAELSLQTAASDAERARLDTQLRSQEGEIDRLRVEVKDQRCKAEAVEAAIAVAHDQAGQVAMLLSESERQLNEVHAILLTERADGERLRAELTACQQQVIQAASERDAKARELGRLHETSCSREATLAQLEQSRCDLEVRSSVLQNEVEVYIGKLAVMQDQLVEALSENAQLRKDMADRDRKLLEIETERRIAVEQNWHAHEQLRRVIQQNNKLRRHWLVRVIVG
jgi:hypothetical protein